MEEKLIKALVSDILNKSGAYKKMAKMFSLNRDSDIWHEIENKITELIIKEDN